MTKDVALSELVLDWDIYPRTTVDGQIVAQYAEALRAGAVFPPILADTKSRRVIDGWKRYKALYQVLGPDAAIAAIFKPYKDEAAIIADAIAFNSSHGEPLGPLDYQHCVLLARKHNLDEAALAKALHITRERLDVIMDRLHRTRNGGAKPSKQASRHLCGGVITEVQKTGIDEISGQPQQFMIRQVISLIQRNLLNRESEQVMERLRELYDLLRKEFEE